MKITRKQLKRLIIEAIGEAIPPEEESSLKDTQIAKLKTLLYTDDLELYRTGVNLAATLADDGTTKDQIVMNMLIILARSLDKRKASLETNIELLDKEREYLLRLANNALFEFNSVMGDYDNDWDQNRDEWKQYDFDPEFIEATYFPQSSYPVLKKLASDYRYHKNNFHSGRYHDKLDNLDEEFDIVIEKIEILNEEVPQFMNIENIY